MKVLDEQGLSYLLSKLDSRYDVSGKVDKVDGKGLSTNDYTAAEKNKLADIAAGAEVNVQSDWNQTNSAADDYIKNKPTIPTVNNNTIVIQKNSANVDSFTLNQSSNKTINITVPTKTSDLTNDSGYITDISGKADSSAAIGSISLSMDSNTYKISITGTKVNGTAFTVSDVIDLPLESVVVSGSYDSTNKKVVLTLKSGSTVEFSVADLINGLQPTIDANHKLSADLISDGTTNKVYTATEKTKLSGIETGALKNVLADWNLGAYAADSYIANKPSSLGWDETYTDDVYQHVITSNTYKKGSDFLVCEDLDAFNYYVTTGNLCRKILLYCDDLGIVNYSGTIWPLGRYVGVHADYITERVQIGDTLFIQIHQSGSTLEYQIEYIFRNTKVDDILTSLNLIKGEDDLLYQIHPENGDVTPLSHPDLSTLPSILPQRFGKYDIKEVLLPIEKASKYDAEVEYLEGTGTQWIDTGVYPDNTYTFDCKVAVLQDNYNCVYWGVRSTGTYQSYNSQCYLNSNTAATGSVASRSIHLYSTTADANVSAYNQNWDSGIIPTIGTMYSLTGMTVVSTMITMTYPVTLFAFNITGDVVTPYNIRIGSWTAYSNGIKIADFIPVRVGQVGYMYDKVSKQLFGNSGTGDFILGPDIINYNNQPGTDTLYYNDSTVLSLLKDENFVNGDIMEISLFGNGYCTHPTVKLIDDTYNIYPMIPYEDMGKLEFALIRYMAVRDNYYYVSEVEEAFRGRKSCRYETVL